MIGCIIQARMGSTRLTGKAMRLLDGKKPILDYVIEQLKNCKTFKKIIIATTNLKDDDLIAQFALEKKIDHFRGSLNDVLDRYYSCAKLFSLDTIVRITSDNPLIDPEIVDNVVEIFKKNDYDYISNCLPRTFPQGTETEVFTFSGLKLAWLNAKKPSEREHVTPYFYNNTNKFKIFNVTHFPDLSKYRWTIDREPDYELVKAIVTKIKKRPILMNDILNLLSDEKMLIEFNKDIIPDEGYLKSLEEDKNFNS